MENKIKKTDPDKKFRRVLAASTLAGDSVRNAAGEDLGKLDEIMIDIPSGRVAYAVLSFGGVLRMGNKLFAVPWSAIRVDEDKKCFILDVDKTKLEKAPGFDKSKWPDMADTTWGSEVFRYYGAPPYWEDLSLIHISEPTRRTPISYAVFCLKKKKKKKFNKKTKNIIVKNKKTKYNNKQET